MNYEESYTFFQLLGKKKVYFKKYFKSLCETKPILQVSSNLVSVIETLDQISKGNDLKIASKSSMLTKSQSNAEFILTLNLVFNVFTITALIS